MSLLILVGAALGLAALFMNWTGDARGIDYIQPSKRFERGYIIPLPLSILAIVAIVGIGVTFVSTIAGLINLRWGTSLLRWLGGLGGLVMGLTALAIHLGYRLWIYIEEFGVVAFRSADWGSGIWVALGAGVLAVGGTVVSGRMTRARQ